MKKAIVVQPMSGKTYEDIVATRTKALVELRARECSTLNPDIADAGSFLNPEGVESAPMHRLARLLSTMSLCKVAYFCKDWETDLLCKMAHDVATACGLEIIQE